MQFQKTRVSPLAARMNECFGDLANLVVRSYDQGMERLGLGGRKAPYDDVAFEFLGGPSDPLRKR